eukprot:Colp12_sorted_trinity150504_noHs@16873
MARQWKSSKNGKKPADQAVGELSLNAEGMSSLERAYWKIVSQKCERDPRRLTRGPDGVMRLVTSPPWTYSYEEYDMHDPHFKFHPDIYKTCVCRLHRPDVKNYQCQFIHPLAEDPAVDLPWRTRVVREMVDHKGKTYLVYPKAIAYGWYRHMVLEYRTQDEPCPPNTPHCKGLVWCPHWHTPEERRFRPQLEPKMDKFVFDPKDKLNPNHYKLKLCSNMQPGLTCDRDRFCPFAHSPEEIKTFRAYHKRLAGEMKRLLLRAQAQEEPQGLATESSTESTLDGQDGPGEGSDLDDGDTAEDEPDLPTIPQPSDGASGPGSGGANPSTPTTPSTPNLTSTPPTPPQTPPLAIVRPE